MRLRYLLSEFSAPTLLKSLLMRSTTTKERTFNASHSSRGGSKHGLESPAASAIPLKASAQASDASGDWRKYSNDRLRHFAVAR
ncbi:MAG: hypothetical protein JWO31_2438 [Phycisphaerales bacterium]|nr:hypothetical protein [Phycisphaerales bacterium]